MTPRQGGKGVLMNSALLGSPPTQDSTVFSVRFVKVSVILEADGSTSSFP